MTPTLLSLALLVTAILFWLDSARARELATAVVDELCRRRGFQLLDGTVGLERLGLARTDHGLRLKRIFRFDYSIEGVGRQQGHILLHGTAVVKVDLIDPQAEEQEIKPVEPPPGDHAQQDNGKVIPFRRRD